MWRRKYGESCWSRSLWTIGEYAHRPNGEFRPELAPPGFLVLVPAGEHDVAAVLHGVQQLDALGGVGLHVVVHQQDEVALGLSQARHDGVVLAGVLRAVDADHAVVRGAELLDGREGAVPFEPSFTRMNSYSYPALTSSDSRLIDDGADHFLRVVAGDNYRNKHKAPP